MDVGVGFLVGRPHRLDHLVRLLRAGAAVEEGEALAVHRPGQDREIRADALDIEVARGGRPCGERHACAPLCQEWTSSVSAARMGPSGRCSSRSEEHTSELQSLMRISYAVFCL